MEKPSYSRANSTANKPLWPSRCSSQKSSLQNENIEEKNLESGFTSILNNSEHQGGGEVLVTFILEIEGQSAAVNLFFMLY